MAPLARFGAPPLCRCLRPWPAALAGCGRSANRRRCQALLCTFHRPWLCRRTALSDWCRRASLRGSLASLRAWGVGCCGDGASGSVSGSIPPGRARTSMRPLRDGSPRLRWGAAAWPLPSALARGFGRLWSLANGTEAGRLGLCCGPGALAVVATAPRGRCRGASLRGAHGL